MNSGKELQLAVKVKERPRDGSTGASPGFFPQAVVFFVQDGASCVHVERAHADRVSLLNVDWFQETPVQQFYA